MQNSVENNQDDGVIIAKKIASEPFIVVAVVAFLITLFATIASINSKYYYGFIIVTPITCFGILVFIKYLQQRKLPEAAIKQREQMLDIYDRFEKKYITIHLLHVFNIECKTNPRFPTKSGYLVIRTKDLIIETITLTDCEQAKNQILSLKFGLSH